LRRNRAWLGLGGFCLAHAERAENLDGNLALQLGIKRGVNHAHAARAQAVEDEVAPHRIAAVE
jgi:hypothetical protein